MQHRDKIIDNAQIQSIARIFDEAEVMAENFMYHMRIRSYDSLTSADIQEYWTQSEEYTDAKFTEEEQETITYVAGRITRHIMQSMDAALCVEQYNAKELSKTLVGFAARSARRRQRKQRKGIVRDLLNPSAPVLAAEEVK